MSESGADEKNRARTHVMLLCDKNGSVHVEINVDTMKNIEEEEEDGVNLVNENRKEILEEKEEVGGGSQNRQVLAKLEKLDEDEDATLCSICLDEFTEEDPVTQTVCEVRFFAGGYFGSISWALCFSLFDVSVSLSLSLC